jgi:hypothetical protein
MVAGIADGDGTEGGVGMGAGGDGAVAALATARWRPWLRLLRRPDCRGQRLPPWLVAVLGGTAGTRRSMEGIRTGLGIRPTSLPASERQGGFRTALSCRTTIEQIEPQSN